MSTLTFNPSKIIASRNFGEFNRYRLDVFLTRFETIEFFLFDADTSEEKPFCSMQSDNLSDCVKNLSLSDREDLLLRQPSKKGQIAINLNRHPVRVIKFDDDKGVLVECLGTKQKWFSKRENLVLIK